jgi:trans-aconitate methyltransferase
MPTTAAARQWLERWDRQQEFHVPDREERFAVIADVVEAIAERPNPLVLDLGAGPGSLTLRLIDRIPGAQVIAVDADATLLGLARAACADRRSVRFVERDLRDRSWTAALDLCRPVDAIVSTTALHWLTEPELAALYRDCAGLLRSGGVLANGDHLAEPAGVAVPALQDRVERARAQRRDAAEAEDWSAWWAAVADAPELADLAGAGRPRPIDHDVPAPPDYATHVRLLAAAGFAEAGTVWQSGANRVLVAVR